MDSRFNKNYQLRMLHTEAGSPVKGVYDLPSANDFLREELVGYGDLQDRIVLIDGLPMTSGDVEELERRVSRLETNREKA